MRKCVTGIASLVFTPIRAASPRAIVLFLAIASFAGCDGPMEEIRLEIEGHTFVVEVARNEEERRQGLMHRKSLDENRGMLFVFDRDRRMSFWMKNTYIPLSIAYISSGGEIKEIHDMQPESLRSIESERSVRYALELNQGAFDRIGAEPGSMVEFPEGFE